MSDLVLEREQTEAVVAGLQAEEPAPAVLRPALRARSLTLEHALYTLALGLSLVLRLAALAAAPLHLHEATGAWPAWLAASGQPVAHAPLPSSALLFSSQVSLFWLFGAHDTLARLIPALAGGMIVLLPWFWRTRLGRTPALVLAFLLALDPWLLGLSRSGASAMLSAALGLLALTALEKIAANYTEDNGADAPGHAPWPAVATISLSLLAVSGPQAWSWLGVIVLFLIIAARGAHGSLRALRAWQPWALGAGVALVAGTALLAQPGALAQVGGSLSAWLSLFSPGSYAAGWPWLRLLVDQPFLLVFGVAGLAGLVRRIAQGRGDRYGWFLLAWLGWASLLLLLPGRDPFTLPLLGVPLAVLAAGGLGALLWLADAADDWREGALLAGVLVILAFAALFWFVGLLWEMQWAVLSAQVAVLLAGAAVLVTIAYALWMSRRQALLIAALLSALALWGASLSSAWQLAYRSEPGREDGFYAVEGHPGARLLAEDAARLSAIRTGDPAELAVQVQTGPSLAPDAQLAWELRAMRNVTWEAVVSPPAGADRAHAPLLVTGPVVDAAWALPYRGALYTLRTSWLPGEQLPPLRGQQEGEQAVWANAVRPWLRWMIYRDARPPALPPVPEQAVLWAAQ